MSGPLGVAARSAAKLASPSTGLSFIPTTLRSQLSNLRISEAPMIHAGMELLFEGPSWISFSYRIQLVLCSMPCWSGR